MGFFDTVKKQYKKGAKMVDDYQEGAKKRDMEAAERFRAKTKALKEKTKYKKELVKAKADYVKVKGKPKSMFDSGNSMFGGGKGADFGLGGGMSMGSNKPASMTSQGWGVGGAMAQDKPKKARKKRSKARKGKVKKVVYYN